MITGQLHRYADNTLLGHIASLTFDVDVMLTENPHKSHDKHPDYVITAKSPRDRSIRIGSAWEQTSRAGNKYLSIALAVNGQTIRANALRREEQSTDDETIFEIVAWAD